MTNAIPTVPSYSIYVVPPSGVRSADVSDMCGTAHTATRRIHVGRRPAHTLLTVRSLTTLSVSRTHHSARLMRHTTAHYITHHTINSRPKVPIPSDPAPRSLDRPTPRGCIAICMCSCESCTWLRLSFPSLWAYAWAALSSRLDAYAVLGVAQSRCAQGLVGLSRPTAARASNVARLPLPRGASFRAR